MLKETHSPPAMGLFCLCGVILSSMIKKILGFDCSSTTVGWGLLEWNNITNDIKFIRTSYFKPIKDGTIIERIADTRDKIQKILLTTKPDYIGIEEIISFMKGGSTAKTVILLTTFNRMIGLVCYDYLSRSPELFSVISIRHGLKIGKILPKKEDMSGLVSQLLGITFPYEYNKKGKPKVENEDMADGIAVALYHAYILSDRIVKKSKKK